MRLRALWRRASFLLWAGFAVSALAVLAVLYAPAIGRALAPLAREPLGPQPDLTLTVLARYMGLVVWPSRLLADYRGDALLPGLGETTPWSALLAIVAWIAAGAALAWRGSPAGAGLLWFPVALLPVLQIVPYREVLAEHNAYLALAGPAIASAAAVDAMAGTLRKPARLVALLAVLLVLLGWRTSRRCADWTDDLTLWSRTIEDGGDGFRARYNRGVALLASARLAEARRDLEVAVARDPGSRPAAVALALAHLRSGDDAAAEATARRALSLGPDASGQAVLGWALLARGELVGARSAFDAALRLQPGHDEATRGLHVVEGRRRQPDQAGWPGR